MISVSGALILALLASTALCSQAPKVKKNPRNVVAIADFPQGYNKWNKGVLGNVIFSARSGKAVKVHVDMTGLPETGGPFQYHIHESQVPANGDCEAVGLHFNPYQALPECAEQGDDSYCQVGDLSGKHGWIDTTCFETKYTDPFLSLNPKSKAYIVGRSVTFHFANLTKFACADIQLVSQSQLVTLSEDYKKLLDEDASNAEYQEILELSEDAYVFDEDDSVKSEAYELAVDGISDDGTDYVSARQLRVQKGAHNLTEHLNVSATSVNSTHANGTHFQLFSSDLENGAVGSVAATVGWSAVFGVMVGLLL